MISSHLSQGFNSKDLLLSSKTSCPVLPKETFSSAATNLSLFPLPPHNCRIVSIAILCHRSLLLLLQQGNSIRTRLFICPRPPIFNSLVHKKNTRSLDNPQQHPSDRDTSNMEQRSSSLTGEKIRGRHRHISLSYPVSTYQHRIWTPTW